jgi:mono/diheme cytochrome c family protein
VNALRGGRAWRLLGAAALVLSVAACRQDMHDQPSYSALESTDFFGDDQASRPLVAGTVARGQLRDDTLLYTGKDGNALAAVFPMPVDDALMARGRERYNVYCSPCHGETGLGDGMVVRRGYKRPPSLAEERLRALPVGHFFDVITNGLGAMPDYAAQIKVNDRWAIAAYIRALQLSAHATVDDVPVAERPRLDQPPQPAGAAAAAESHD